MRERSLESVVPPNLRQAVRSRLLELGVAPEHHAEIAEELLQHACDAAEAQRIDTSDLRAVEAWLAGDQEWSDLARELARSASSRRRNRAERLVRAGGPATGLLGDVVQAARSLRSSPGFTLVAILLLALGIGLVATVFSVVDRMLLAPLPVEDEDRLVRLFTRAEDGFFGHSPLSVPELDDIEAQARTLTGVAGFALTFTAIQNADRSELVLANMVTGDFFDLLGVKPAAGRLLEPGDDRRGDPQSVLVLGHESWVQRFGADPGIVGRELRINGQPLVVVGVAAKGFRGLWRGIEPALYLPVGTALLLGAEPSSSAGGLEPGVDLRDQRTGRWLWGVARRLESASVDESRSEIEAVGRALAAAYPEDETERGIAALPLREVKVLPGVDGGIRTISWVLFGVVAMVLLIACANLANLLLSRAVRRRQEMATRLSLGAGRWQIARLLLVESLLLATLGGLAGLALASAATATLNRIRLPIVVPIELHLAIDQRVVVFTFAVAALTTLIFGLAPVLESWRTDLATALRRDSARGGSRRRRLQSALVVAQVTLSLLLLVAAGLSLRSVLNAQRIDPGFEVEGAVAATLMLELQGYDEGRIAELYRRLREDLAALPGVIGVTLPSHLPLTLWTDTWRLVPKEQEHLPVSEWPSVDVARVDADYFETMGVSLVGGRTFSAAEIAGSRRFAIVNETLAGRFWPGEDAVGRLLGSAPGEEPFLVVGVARNGRYRTLGEDPRPFAYMPISDDWSSRTVVARFERPDLASPAAVAGVIRGIDRHLAVSNLAMLRDVIGPSLILPRAGALVFGAIGSIGLLLAAVGLYGLLAYAVSQRTHEIGLRLALGARRADVLRMVLRDGLRLTLAGAALGLVAAVASTRALRTLLFGISPTDGWTFSVVVIVLLAVAALASVLPARRAMRIDPTRAMRHD
jgi:predicted permease